MAIDIQEFLAKFDGVKKSGAGWIARCPSHDDRKQSLCIDHGRDGGIVVFCQASCQTKAVLEAAGCTFADLQPEHAKPNGQAKPKIVATYDYRDRKGSLLYQVVRFEPKDFRPRRPDGAGGWIWDLKGVERTLYRLPELLADDSDGWVFLCYSEDTEVLTTEGWLRFPELPQDARVAQYNRHTGEISFVLPEARHVFDYSGQMIHIKANWCDLLVTPDHRMLAKFAHCHPRVIPASDIHRAHRLPVSGFLSRFDDCALTIDQVRLLTAFLADGHWEPRGFKLSWNLKKGRKQERLKQILHNLNLLFDEQQYESAPGWTRFVLNKKDVSWLEEWQEDKAWKWDALRWPLEVREAILNELGYWDGDFTGYSGTRFFSQKQQDADVISAIAAITGYSAIVRTDSRPQRPNYQDQYIVNLKPADWRILAEKPSSQNYEGKVYCLTVPDGFFVVRRNGKVTIAGNCEGEKDVDEGLRTLGLTATCNVGGAGKWKSGYAAYFKGRKVCILPDNDGPPTKGEDGKKKEGFAGQKHAVRIYESLQGVAEVVRILALPNLPPKGDVCDWRGAGGTRDELLALADDLARLPEEEYNARVSQYARLVADATAFAGDPAAALRGELSTPKNLLAIDFGLIKDLPTLTAAAWRALFDANEPPRYFKRGEMLVRIEEDEEYLVTAELTPDRMRHTLARVALWYKKGMEDKPPKDVVADVLATPAPALPRLHRIVEVPVFAPDGSLQTEPGYHPASKTYYWPSRHLKCLPVPVLPSEYDVGRSVALIEEMITDFPFAEQSDKANAIGLLLLPFCRELIPGPTPLHLFEASKERTGKSKLAMNLLYIALGNRIFRLTEAGRNQEEWSKEITTALLADRGAILIDNINHKLDSGHLARALTEPVWNGRILGRSASADIPVRCVWAATGNNLMTSGEMAGRIVRCRLVTNVESPELRTDFKHADLEEWVERERERLIQAAHILIQHWLANGRPAARTKPLGRFEAWSRVIGGILESAGIAGFLENFRSSSEDLNAERAAWREFCRKWLAAHHSRQESFDPEAAAFTLPKSAADLLPLVEGIEEFYLVGESEASRAKSLGRQLRAKKGSVYELRDENDELLEICQIVEGKLLHGIRQWHLKLLGGEEIEKS